jgi:HAMP domain-containing protein
VRPDLIGENLQKSIKSRTASLLQYAGLVFCFFVFPLFVFNASLASLLDLKLNNHKHQVYQQLSDRLKLLLPYNDERRYYSFVLQKIFNLATQQSDPAAYLEKAITRLKNNHPGRFEFIVWDNSGKVIEKLTDEKRFRFVVNKLYLVLKEVTNHLAAGNPEEIKKLTVVKDNFNLIKHFLGRIFLPETLNQPYLADDQSSLILADYGKTRPYFWYHTDAKISMLCFIAWDAIADTRGLHNMVKALNAGNKDICIGLASIHDLSNPYLCKNAHVANEVVMALARYENSSEPTIETANTQIVVQMHNLQTRIFALHLKNDEIYTPEIIRLRAITQAVVLYLLTGLLLYFNFKVRRAFFSIRWKLLLLFMYANLAPITVLGAISYDYLQSRKVALRNEFQLESARLLRELDSRFIIQNEKYTRQLNSIVDSINAESGSQMLNTQQIDRLKTAILEYRPSEAFLVDHKGVIHFGIAANGRSVSHSISYVKNLADAILKFQNRIIVTADKADVLTKISDPEHTDFVRNSIRDSRKIWPMSIADKMKMSYWNMLGKPDEYINNYFLLLLWDEEEFQRIFLDQYFCRLPRNNLMAGAFARTSNGRQIFPDIAKDSNELAAFLKDAAHSSGNIYGSLQFAGQTHLATGWRGKNMNSTSFIIVYPISEIDAEIGKITRHIFAGAAMSIILTIIIALAVARQFLVPIKSLSAAATAVSLRDYRHRIDIADQDEFGHLGQVMNRMIEGLGELEIAKIVQESLFPEKQPNFLPFDIYGQSVAATTLAGDYYDLIEIDSNRMSVMIGDVAGHGIAAALIMAMAKAGVKMAKSEEMLNGGLFIEELHKILYSLKDGQLKRMMTFQYLLLDKTSAGVNLYNAGHCYPLVVDSRSSETKLIELVSMPLGVDQSPQYSHCSVKLQPGQALILYTDGFIQVKNATGEIYGRERLMHAALHHYHKSSESYYNALYQEYLDWSGKSSGDDCTMIIIGHPES